MKSKKRQAQWLSNLVIPNFIPNLIIKNPADDMRILIHAENIKLNFIINIFKISTYI